MIAWIMPLRQLFAVRAFRNLWLGMLVSSGGSFLLSLALSLAVYAGTRSALLAGSVFSVQWILPLLAASQIAGLFRRYDLRSVAIAAELAGLAVTLLIALAYDDNTGALFALLMARGFLEAVSKSARSIAVKSVLPAALLRAGAAFFATGYYLGAMLGAGIGALLLGALSIPQIAAIDALSFVAAAVLYSALPRSRSKAPAKTGRGGSWTACFDQFARNSALFSAFWRLMITAALFQGFMTVARAVLPLDNWHGDSAAAGAAQFLAGAAIMLGALLPTLEPTGAWIDRHINVCFALTAGFMIATAYAPDLLSGLPSYFLFVALFEVCFTKFQRDVIVLTPADALPDVSALMNALMMGLMTLVVTLVGLAARATGLTLVAIAVAVVALGSTSACQLAAERFMARPKQASPQ